MSIETGMAAEVGKANAIQYGIQQINNQLNTLCETRARVADRLNYVLEAEEPRDNKQAVDCETKVAALEAGLTADLREIEQTIAQVNEGFEALLSRLAL